MGSEEDPRDFDASRKLFKIGFAVAGVSGILMWLMVFIWVFYYGGGISWGTNSHTEVNLHIILMIFFMVYLQGHGALLFRIFPSRPKFQLKLFHAGIHLSVIFALGFASWSAFNSHAMKGIRHLYTLHSWIGFTAILLYYGQFLVGFFVFLLPWAPMRIRNMIIPYHKFIGPMIFLCSVAAAATGLMMKALGSLGDKYATMPSEAYVINFAGYFLMIFAIAVTGLLFDSRFRRRARPEGELLLGDSASGSQ